MSDSLHFFFDGWGPVLRILVVGTLSYLALMVMVRISGVRTLARMNPFDFVITVAIGSTFGRILTAEDVTLIEGTVAFAVLIALHVLTSTVISRAPRLSRLLNGEPALVFYRGEFQRGNMRRERVTEAELRGSVRENGFGSMEEIEAIAVESNGGLTVVAREKAGNGSALRELRLGH